MLAERSALYPPTPFPRMNALKAIGVPLAKAVEMFHSMRPATRALSRAATTTTSTTSTTDGNANLAPSPAPSPKRKRKRAEATPAEESPRKTTKAPENLVKSVERGLQTPQKSPKKSPQMSPSPKKSPRVTIGEGAKKPPQEDWRRTYDLIKEYDQHTNPLPVVACRLPGGFVPHHLHPPDRLRKDRSAPVDSFGSEALMEKDTCMSTYRYQCLIGLMLSSQTKDQMVLSCPPRRKLSG